jgi:hypothetical protein
LNIFQLQEIPKRWKPKSEEERNIISRELKIQLSKEKYINKIYELADLPAPIEKEEVIPWFQR